MQRVAVIGQTTARPTKLERQRLSLGTDDMVVRIVRIRYWNERPQALERISLPLRCFPSIGGDGAIAWDLHEFARRDGVALGLARERISNVRATATVAVHLAVSRGARLTRSDRIIFSADSVPLEWRVSFAVQGSTS